MTALRERLVQAGEDARLSGDATVEVAAPILAALVAVADAAARSREPISTEAGFDADINGIGAVLTHRDHAMDQALHALAAALGVSR